SPGTTTSGATRRASPTSSAACSSRPRACRLSGMTSHATAAGPRLRSIAEEPVGGKRVLVRVDLNVPMRDGAITDDTRIRATLETIRHLVREDATVILMSHLGRPGGKVDPALTLKPVAERLSELLERPVMLAPDTI